MNTSFLDRRRARFATLRSYVQTCLGASHTGASCTALFALMCVVLASTAPSANAQTPTEQINARYEKVRESTRSDLVIVPLLGDMLPPPPAVADRRAASLTAADMRAWPAASKWAQGEAQQALLEGLKKVTQEQRLRRAYVFAQPYGQEALVSQDGGLDLISRNLYTEIPGDPPLLAGAKFHLLPKFDDMVCLLHVEATRLAAAGDPDAAASVLADGILFARQIADRAFAIEANWGYDAISELEERIRDVYYLDFRSPAPKADSSKIIDLIKRLDEQTGFLEMTRARFPEGDLLAADQLVALVMDERGGPRDGVFGTVLASLGSTEHPLRLFSENARWRDAAKSHANWYETTDTLKAIGNDYRFRWSRAWSDPVQRPPTTYKTLEGNREKFAAIFAAVPEIESLYLARLRAQTEAEGTRHSLAVLGFTLDNGVFPISLAATRPRYIPRVDADPLNNALVDGRDPVLEYFVPIRDTARGRNERDVPEPHEIVVINPTGEDLAIRLRDDQFVLYSVGTDSQKNWAREVQNTTDAPSGRDYMFWPPVLSLIRQDLIDTGKLR